MPYFITIQYPYQHLEVTITKDLDILHSITISKFQAVQLLVPTLKQLILENNLSIHEISCIGVNTGPGPFNTLRALISTVNAISFAQNIPLVNCNGLQLLLQENSSLHNQVAILDACGNDVYFAIQTSQQEGYASIQELIDILNKLYSNHDLVFIGNGAQKHHDYILNNFQGKAVIDVHLLFAQSKTLIKETYEKYQNHIISYELFPLYFQSPITKS